MEPVPELDTVIEILNATNDDTADVSSRSADTYLGPKAACRPRRRQRADPTTIGSDGCSNGEGTASDGEGQPRPSRRESKRNPKYRHEGRTPAGAAATPHSWLKIGTNGVAEELKGDKRALAQVLGLQQRELRFLDPQTAAIADMPSNIRHSMIGAPLPLAAAAMASSISGRNGAILINLEFIKCVVTCDVVYVLSLDYPQVPHLITDLELRLNKKDLLKTDSFEGLVDARSLAPTHHGSLLPLHGGVALPFELKALEICLDMITFHFDTLTSDLESSTFPALDIFVHSATGKRLERVRRIKNALVQLITRVENVCGVLEKLLADDKDMYHLNLTAVDMEATLARNSLTRHSLGRHSIARKSRRRSSVSPCTGGCDTSEMTGASPRGVVGGGSMSSYSSGASSFWMSEEARAVAQVEMLVETYFMRLDQTHNRLQTLQEYIRDTEDLVNTQLDQHRNKLITVDLFLTAFLSIMGLMTILAGLFGVNLNYQLEETVPLFEVIVGVVAGGSVLLFALFCAWALWSGVVEFD